MQPADLGAACRPSSVNIPCIMQHVVVDGKTIKQENSFVYLGGTVCEYGGSSKEL